MTERQVFQYFPLLYETAVKAAALPQDPRFELPELPSGNCCVINEAAGAQIQCQTCLKWYGKEVF